ncbi:MAG: hypothetical protein LBL59_11320 [Xanthomonadaceae bacterium]|nr:hypothetical protein [Xanthomonadaceae bacterium]
MQQSSRHTDLPPATALWSAFASTGLGLLLWLGIGTALLLTRGGLLGNLLAWQKLTILTGIVTTLLGTPLILSRALQPAWRPRMLIGTLITLLIGVALWVMLTRQAPTDAGVLSVSGAALCIAATLSVLCLAASFPVAEERASLLAPLLLCSALLSGAAVLFALLSLKWPGYHLAAAPGPSLMLLAAMNGALLLLWWNSRGGLSPIWEQRWRWFVLELSLLMPILLIGLSFYWPQLSHIGWTLIAISIFAGTCIEHYRLMTEAD